MESWDLFSFMFPLQKQSNEEEIGSSSSENPIRLDSSFNRSSNASTNNFETSRHVDLRDSKLAVSFVGTDDILIASHFELLKPFIPSLSTDLLAVSTRNASSLNTLHAQITLSITYITNLITNNITI